MIRNMKDRNFGVELFRIICMLAICMQHAVYFSETGAKGFEGRFWNFGVVGFALITGYYGISFKIGKIVKLWFTAIVCAGVALALGAIRGCGGGGYIDLLCNNWYLNGYTVLILLSPLLNAALDNLFNSESRGKLRHAAMAVVALVCWSWLQELYGVRDFMPRVLGMGSKSFMTLLYVYLVGRCLRQYGMPQFIICHRVPIIVGSLLLIPILGSYNSPVTILFTVLLFLLFERIWVSESYRRIINLIVPSLFAVYLLHTNSVGFGLIEKVCKRLMLDGVPRYLSYVMCASFVFGFCLLLDCPRRLLSRIMSRNVRSRI